MAEYRGNDNIRTHHLKCEKCGVQVFLDRIEQMESGLEARVFKCPHCGHSKSHVISGSKKIEGEGDQPQTGKLG